MVDYRRFQARSYCVNLLQRFLTQMLAENARFALQGLSNLTPSEPSKKKNMNFRTHGPSARGKTIEQINDKMYAS